tara:strand:+ start:1616 stop:2455 length:840 start_codon:yes stop_codon:yes gene_type:complete
MERLEGRVAVITGGANGIGAALARGLAGEGCKLVLVDVEIERPALDAIAKELRANGTQVMAEAADVASWDAMQALATKVQEEFGGTQLVVANAGVTLVGRPMAMMSMNDWNWVLGVNLFGVIHTVQAFMPQLVAANDAQVVITASGVCSFMGVGGNGPYCASKAAVISYAESLYRELAAAKSHIHVTALCPGAVPATLGDSEKRRPATLPDLLEVDPAPPGFREMLKKMRDDGLPPQDAAQICIDAIKTNQFYAMTHSDAADWIKARGEDAVARRNPNV